MKHRIPQESLSPRHLEIIEMAKRNGFLATEELSRTLKVTEAIGDYRLVAIGENTATFEGPEGAVVLRQER